MTLHLMILKSAGLLVPRQRRADWLAEWTSELWYVSQQYSPHQRRWFCLGAFRDALWLRRNQPNRVQDRLQSPLTCLMLLAAMATVSITLFLRPGGPFDTVRLARCDQSPLSAHLMMVGFALVILSGSTSFSLGEYPGHSSSPAHARRFLRWLFLALKFAVIVPIVFCATFDVLTMLSASRVEPHATIVGYVVAFRWVLRDQRRRCPVCLRLLNRSASIGEFSHNFLDWYGTEHFCAKGHGLLHVPAIETTYSTQRWSDLDGSWNVLFS